MTKSKTRRNSRRYRRKKGGMNGNNKTTPIITSDLFTPVPDNQAATAKYTFRKGDIKTSQNTIDFDFKDNPLFDEAAQNLERIDMTKADREAHSQRLDEIIKTYDAPMDDFGKKDDGCPKTGCIISGGRKTRRYRRKGRKIRKSRRR